MVLPSEDFSVSYRSLHFKGIVQKDLHLIFESEIHEGLLQKLLTAKK
jgi:hypothetical protein